MSSTKLLVLSGLIGLLLLSASFKRDDRSAYIIQADESLAVWLLASAALEVEPGAQIEFSSISRCILVGKKLRIPYAKRDFWLGGKKYYGYSFACLKKGKGASEKEGGWNDVLAVQDPQMTKR